MRPVLGDIDELPPAQRDAMLAALAWRTSLPLTCFRIARAVSRASRTAQVIPAAELAGEHMFGTVRTMDRARFALAMPDDRELLGRLTTALAVQSDPPISLARAGEAVIALESATGEMMLRSRVMQALEVAAGPDWQSVARPID